MFLRKTHTSAARHEHVGAECRSQSSGPAIRQPVFLGRQPIYTAERQIEAYELLYRRAATAIAADVIHPDQASAEVLLKAFLEIGLPTVSPDQPVFVNHTRYLLSLDPIIPADRCIIEVLEDVPVDETTIAAVKRLKNLGYRIALDDFVYADKFVPLLHVADFVKLDVTLIDVKERARQVRLLRGYGVRIIAEKIESEGELKTWADLGCDLFQGYYLRRPEVLGGKRIPANRLSAISLLAACKQSDDAIDRITQIVGRDAALTYGLLQLANSAVYSGRAEIRSAHQAVARLGIDCVFRWASLLVLAGYDDCPVGYLEFALQRARACELVAVAGGWREPEAFYIVGLLSALDAILDAPLNEIITPLPLDEAISHAVRHKSGVLGSVLAAVLAYESGEWDEMPSYGVDSDVLRRSFWAAAEYATQMLAQLHNIAVE